VGQTLYNVAELTCITDGAALINYSSYRLWDLGFGDATSSGGMNMMGELASTAG